MLKMGIKLQFSTLSTYFDFEHFNFFRIGQTIGLVRKVCLLSMPRPPPSVHHSTPKHTLAHIWRNF